MYSRDVVRPPPVETRRRTVGDVVRERILDGAEELFAEKGFFGASIRDITEHAGVRLAGINYHFGTKEELFRDVLLRRAVDLSAERLRLLGEVPHEGSAPRRTRAIVGAFVTPVLKRAADDSGFRNYCALIAQVASSRVWALTLVADQFNVTATAFVRALEGVFPRAPEPSLHHAYQFLLSCTLYGFSDNLRLDSLTAGELHSGDFSAISESLVEFVSAGVLSLCTGARPPSPRKAASRAKGRGEKPTRSRQRRGV